MQIKVQAIRTGYHNHIRQREKSKFLVDTSLFIKKEKVLKPGRKLYIKVGKDELLVPSWMKVIDPKVKVFATDSEGKIVQEKNKPEPEMDNEVDQDQEESESEEGSGAEDQEVI